MKKKLLMGIACVTLSAALLAGCGGGGRYNEDHASGDMDYTEDVPNYYEPSGPSASDPLAPGGMDIPSGPTVDDGGTESGILSSEQSTYLSLDRNTAGYTLMRSQIYANGRLNRDVRIEELYNYFDYDYPEPENGEGVKATAYLSDCPWNAENKLLTVGLKTETRTLKKTRNNYVFLVDVSGSMAGFIPTDAGRKKCIDLVKYGINTLVDGLGSRDTVSVVTYASGIQTVLEPTFASTQGRDQIKSAVDGLVAMGATNGSGGLELAYENAEKYFAEDGNNRVIMLSDGDFNTGITDLNKLKELISEKAKSGVYLSVVGVGMGTKQDELMQTLALNGNGNYCFIDSEREARKVFCEEIDGTLLTVLKDAKASITFKPEQVASYRMVGYDKKTISQEEFDDPAKDTGEVGSGLCVSTVFEITLTPGAEENAELAEVTVRFKYAETGESREVREKAYNTNTDAQDVAFIACVTEFGLLLRRSKYMGTASMDAVIERLEGMKDYLGVNEYKQEFLEIVKRAQTYGY